MRKRIALCLAPACLGLFLNTCTQLVHSPTPSLPYRWYIAFPPWKTTHFNKGDYVWFAYPPAPYPLIKRIVGTEGDAIKHDKDHQIWVNDTWIGKPISPQEPGMTMNRVAKNTVFVAGTHPQSLDSRYQTIGLIETTKIIGKLFPLW